VGLFWGGERHRGIHVDLKNGKVRGMIGKKKNGGISFVLKKALGKSTIEDDH